MLACLPTILPISTQSGVRFCSVRSDSPAALESRASVRPVNSITPPRLEAASPRVDVARPRAIPPLGSRRWAPNPWTPKAPSLSTSPRRISPRSSERTPHSACSRADPSTLAGPTRSLNRSRVPHTLFARALALSIVFYPPSTTPRRVLRELSLRMLPFSVLSAPFSGRLCLQHPCVYLCSRPVCHPCLRPGCPHRTLCVCLFCPCPVSTLPLL